MTFRKRLIPQFLPVFLILITGTIIYSNSFDVPFVFDDIRQIVENPVTRRLDSFISDDYRYAYNPGRLVAHLTFALNYRLGGMAVFGFHLVNLAIHLANALLVYALAQLTFLTPYFQVQGSRFKVQGLSTQHSTLNTQHFIPLFAALLFVSHPLQTQAVTYVVQRMTSLATLFYLLSLVLYVAARLRFESRVASPESRIQASDDRRQTTEDGRSKSEGGQWKWILLLAGATISAVLAMKTKEIAFTLPFVVLLYEFSFFRGDWKRRLLYLLPILLMAPIIPITVLTAGDSTGEMLPDISDQVRVKTDVPRMAYLLTQFRVIVTYLRLLILPVNQNLDYDYPIYTNFFTPSVFLSFLLLAALMALAMYLYFVSRLTPHASRLAGFGILWFFLTLCVESSLIPIADVIYEHRVYLPSAGFFMAAAAALVLVFERFARGRGLRVTMAAGAIVILCLSVASFKRNEIWQDAVTLWEDTVRKSPGKSRPRGNLGMALEARGKADAAMEQFELAVRFDPNSAEAHTNLGLAFLRKGMVDTAAGHFHLAISLDPELSAPRLNLGAVLVDKGFVDAAIEQYQVAVAIDPRDPKVHNNLGVAFFKKEMIDEAIAEFQRAIDLSPNYAEAHTNLGIAYGSKGWFQQAQQEMMTGMRLQKNQGAR